MENMTNKPTCPTCNTESDKLKVLIFDLTEQIKEQAKTISTLEKHCYEMKSKDGSLEDVYAGMNEVIKLLESSNVLEVLHLRITDNGRKLGPITVNTDPHVKPIPSDALMTMNIYTVSDYVKHLGVTYKRALRGGF